MKKCKHGADKDSCCKCRYGEKSHIDHKERAWDLVDDLRVPIGYKLL